MTQNFVMREEENHLFKPKGTKSDFTNAIFKTSGSAGSNSKRLAQLVSVFDYVMHTLGWDESVNSKGEKVSSNVLLSTIITTNQASIDAKYHNDFKAIAIAEEIDRKRLESRQNNGVSMTQ